MDLFMQQKIIVHVMLKEKNAVITGCQKGIGKKTLEIFASNGANLWACAQTPDESFEKFCLDLAKRTNTWIKPIYFDFLNSDSIKAGLKQISSDKQPIHILANIAGLTKDALFHMTSMDTLKLVFEVNFFAQIAISQYITKIMMRQKQGSVINVSSTSAIDGSHGQLAYSSSKAALIGATKTMSRELAAHGIRVNAIAPGVIDTHMNSTVPPHVIEKHIKSMSIPRLGSSDEVANTILFLASDLSRYVTGQIIRIDGGMK
jgi:3-oxoacyl-[acyl-carrier protein] reductase